MKSTSLFTDSSEEVHHRCRAMLAVATGASITAARLKAGTSCNQVRMWLFIKPRREDMCKNTVLDAVMTTANLPLIQWRQRNVTLSLCNDGSTSGAMQ